jgi:hypothetical protein
MFEKVVVKPGKRISVSQTPKGNLAPPGTDKSEAIIR